MASKKLLIEDFIVKSKSHVLLDVRSPSEYAHAHIPGAINLPLFSDEERKVVGTAYKQQSRQIAIKIGLDFFAVKMRKMVEEIEDFITAYKVEEAAGNILQLFIYCWRGGMRSAGVAWLFDLYGFSVFSLSGGYKAYRNWVLSSLNQPINFKVLGGYTGSGKTALLELMCQKGDAILNLEKLANHKGSAFGGLGEEKQPGQEMYENTIANTLKDISEKFSHEQNKKTIWVEDESARIGQLNIPKNIYETIRQSPVYFLDIPFEKRLSNLVKNYGGFPKEELINSINRINRRLGGLETKNAINYLLENNLAESFRILLKYYDKWYTKGLENRKTLMEKIYPISCDSVSASNIDKLLV